MRSGGGRKKLALNLCISTGEKWWIAYIYEGLGGVLIPEVFIVSFVLYYFHIV